MHIAPQPSVHGTRIAPSTTYDRATGRPCPIGFDVILAIVSARQAATRTARIAGQIAGQVTTERQSARRQLFTRWRRQTKAAALTGAFSDWHPAGAVYGLTTEMNAPFTRAFQPIVNLPAHSQDHTDAVAPAPRAQNDPEREE